MRSCIVSYLDTEGIRHSVEVHADSLYEAVVLAVHTFRQHDCDPCEISKLEVEIRTSVTHEITLKKGVNGSTVGPGVRKRLQRRSDFERCSELVKDGLSVQN